MDKQRWDAHWAAMVRAAHGVLGDRDQAEECAAVALAQMYERSPQDVLNAEAFAVTVAKRRALDELRARERIRRRQVALQTQHEHEVLDVAEGVAQRAEARWMAEQARRLLPARNLQLLQSVADGHEVAHAARALGMTTGSAHSHLRRSRTLLRAVYDKALAVLGLGWWTVKRMTPAAPAVAVVVAITVLTPVAPAPPPALPAASTPMTQVAPVATGAVGSSVAAGRQLPKLVTVTAGARRPATPGSTGRTRPTATPSPLAQVAAPLGGSVTLEKRREGSDEDQGLVDGALSCVANVRVTPQHVGC